MDSNTYNIQICESLTYGTCLEIQCHTEINVFITELVFCEALISLLINNSLENESA